MLQFTHLSLCQTCHNATNVIMSDMFYKLSPSQSVFYASRYADILFQGASTTSVGGLVLAVVIVLVVAVLYELFRQYTASFQDLATCSCRGVVMAMRAKNVSPDVNGSPDNTIAISSSTPGICRRHQVVYVTLSVVLHVVTLTLSYFLMLVAMTFNVWLFLAVVLGSGIGKLATILLMGSPNKDSSTSHCNMP